MSSTSPTVLRLFLVRHAHSGWAAPGMRDFDRPLDAHGREEAARLAAMLLVNGYQPDRVVCSSARRCVETLELLLPPDAAWPAVDYTPELYADGAESYLEQIAAVRDEAVRSIMIVGHNPMVEDTGKSLVLRDPVAYLQALGHGFPTAGLAIFDCGNRGDGAIDGSARFVALLSPVDA
ncbi:SixA phosphatase family protein [Hoeflea olei]|uniref:Phosphohistidine phosphatase n=1 Tax=Hoeflea olei TaxID=1480615 RepID=A0A1C1YZ37_9HYPH|nr:histidine phosphatase family protein [Hoeflea olei]OCW58768.1 hypothetical protein AWJ14_00640 [Hoeflea olei]